MTTRILVALILALAASGCEGSLYANAGHEPADFYMGNGVGREVAAAFAEASAEWCERAGMCVTLRPYHFDTIDGPFERTELGGGTMGRYTPWAMGVGELQIDDDVTLGEIRVTILHELGHHYGCMVHSEDVGTVMYHDSSRTVTHLTDADIECAWDPMVAKESQ